MEKGCRTCKNRPSLSEEGSVCEECLQASVGWPHWKAGETEPDPKAVSGSLKDPLQLLPTAFLRQTAHALKCGADKYGAYNWRTGEGIRASTYIGAIMRHLTQYMDGEDVDAESGQSHIAHIAAGCAILIDAERAHQLTDDRPKTETDDNE